MIEVGGVAVLKVGGVTVTVIPDETGKDRMAIVLTRNDPEVLIDILDQAGNRFGVLTLEADARSINGIAYVSLAANGEQQHISTDTPFPDHMITQSTVRGVEQRPPQPAVKVREVLDVR